ncbi:hypothetical protein MMC28_007280 [Mycoblastus sanguinarius]|nr:hypothetical protein [Mycoblastus sanguinarius]
MPRDILSLLLFLLTLFSHASALALSVTSPELPTISTSLTTNLTTPPHGRFGCLPGGLFTKRPILSDCGGAIRLLRSAPQIGTFRRAGGTAADFQLPVALSCGTCRVLADFNPDVNSEVSSWLEISSAALQLATACIKRATFTGGWTLAGEKSNIRITLSYVRGSALTADNATVAEERDLEGRAEYWDLDG